LMDGVDYSDLNFVTAAPASVALTKRLKHC